MRLNSSWPRSSTRSHEKSQRSDEHNRGWFVATCGAAATGTKPGEVVGSGVTKADSRGTGRLMFGVRDDIGDEINLPANEEIEAPVEVQGLARGRRFRRTCRRAGKGEVIFCRRKPTCLGRLFEHGQGHWRRPCRRSRFFEFSSTAGGYFGFLFELLGVLAK